MYPKIKITPPAGSVSEWSLKETEGKAELFWKTLFKSLINPFLCWKKNTPPILKALLSSKRLSNMVIEHKIPWK